MSLKSLKGHLKAEMIEAAEEVLDRPTYANLNYTDDFLDVLYQGISDIVDSTVDTFEWD
jgi:hypothetical protein